MGFFGNCLRTYLLLHAFLLIPNVVQAFSISGPDEVAVNSTAQYTVSGASGLSIWSVTGNFGVGGGISESGLLSTGSNACGAVTITAYSRGVAATKEVRITGTGNGWQFSDACYDGSWDNMGVHKAYCTVIDGRYSYDVYFRCGIDTPDVCPRKCDPSPYDCTLGGQYPEYSLYVYQSATSEWVCLNCTNLDADSDSYNGFGSCDYAVDCDDSDPDINPGAMEICDGKDNNCNGEVDEGCGPYPLDPSPPDGVGCVGNPIDPFSGMKVYSEFDIGYPAPSMVRVVRSYSSGVPTVGPFGMGTTSNFDLRMVYEPDGSLAYMTPGGGSYAFIDDGSGTYKNSAYPFLRHAKAYVAPERKLEFTDGISYIFNGTDGALEKVEDANGNWVEITRDPSTGDITDIDDSFAQGLEVASIGGIINSISMKSDPSKKVEYQYNPDQTLKSVKQLDGNTVNYHYDNGVLASVSAPSGIAQTISIYNAVTGRVDRQEYINGGVFDLNYTFNGGAIEETSFTEPEGGTYTYMFNGHGYPTEIMDPYNYSTILERDPSTNAIVNTTDPLGRQTSYTYDPSGYLGTITDPAGNTTTFIYNATYGKPGEITDVLGNTAMFEYDPKGNLQEIWLPDSLPGMPFVSITNTPEGLTETVSDALGNTFSFDYYPTGQIANAVDPLGNTVAHYEYNSVGQLVSATSPWPGNKTTSYTYDPMGRIQTITAPTGQTGFTNDIDGNLTEVEDARLNTISFTYNQRGLVDSMTDQSGTRTEYYGYDLNDNLNYVMDRKGQEFTYEYDLMDRMTRAVYPSSGNYTTFDYDPASRITDIREYADGVLDNSIGYGYTSYASGDKFEDRVKTETTTNDGTSNTIAYDYDELGRRTYMNVQGQAMEVYYTYNPNSQLNTITVTGSPAGTMEFGFTYYSGGRLNSMSYPNGVEAAYTYNPTGTVETIQITNSPTSTLEYLSYTYDGIYNRTSMTREGMAVKLPTPISSAPIYDESNRLTSFNSQTVLHDENGNITSWGDRSYIRNVKNQLVEIRDSGQTVATFKYDALGRRIEKTVDGVTTKYLYDGLDIIAEVDASGTPTVFYVRTLDIDMPLARIELATGKIRYYHVDALGSVIALTDETGTVKTRYNYTPFGDTELIGEVSENPFQYAGRENDGTGLYYYRARYYSPEMGRFISEDPIGLAGINYFIYAGNNPVRYIDPLGLDYLDININIGVLGIGITGGIQFDTQDNIYPYIGVGFMTPGGSVSLTTSEDNPTVGINVGVQTAGGIAGQMGYSITGVDYSEIGIGTPGIAITSYRVFGPFNFSNKQSDPNIDLAKCH